MDLHARRCTPCERGTPPLTDDHALRLLAEIPGWAVHEHRSRRRFTFPGFPDAIRFIDRMAEVAEACGHHPDFCVHYREVEVTVWTHAIGGLSDNDFILAAKIDRL